jgi:hypothetical protein
MELPFMSIGMMAGTAQEKYRSLQRGCCETWINECPKVYLFCGDHIQLDFEIEMTEMTDKKAEFIHLNGVGEDYGSASYKHWMGLAYMMKNTPSKWYAIYGSDNYVRYDKVVETLKQFNEDLPLMVGGTIQRRTLDFQVPFNLGGGGAYVTHSALEMIFDRWGGDRESQARSLCAHWISVCDKYNHDLKHACDVALGYYGWQLDIPLIGIRGFYLIDWTGRQYYKDIGAIFSFDQDNIIVCHYMDRSLMLEYHHYLGNV